MGGQRNNKRTGFEMVQVGKSVPDWRAAWAAVRERMRRELGDPVFEVPRRKQDTLLSGRGTGHKRLAGTLQEVRALSRLVPDATVLTGSLACEQSPWAGVSDPASLIASC